MRNNDLKTSLKELGALRRAKNVNVPLRPDEEMIDIGASAGGVDLETARIIYETMVHASLLSKKKIKA
jgi:precorrin-6B methylase 2